MHTNTYLHTNTYIHTNTYLPINIGQHAAGARGGAGASATRERGAVGRPRPPGHY
jgi:hypothetical protein